MRSTAAVQRIKHAGTDQKTHTSSMETAQYNKEEHMSDAITRAELVKELDEHGSAVRCYR